MLALKLCWWKDATPQGTSASVRVRQTYCPGTADEAKGPFSEWFKVEPAVSPLNRLELKYQVGTETLSVRRALVGATVDIGLDGDSWQDVAWSTNMLVPTPFVLKQGASISATQSLCPGTNSENPLVTVVPEEDAKEWLLEPTFGTPICPGSRYVTVGAAVDDGYVQVLHRGVQVASVGGSTHPVAVDMGRQVVLKDSDEISAYQIVHGTNVNLTSPVGHALVDGSHRSFEVKGQIVTTDWSTGDPIEGFPRTGRGPLFVLECCADCDDPKQMEVFGHCVDSNLERRRAKAEVHGPNSSIATVIMVEEIALLATST